MFKIYPWDHGKKPNFVNEEGYEWYFDQSTTNFAKQDGVAIKGLKNVGAFYVKKGDEVGSVLIDDKKNVVAAHDNVIGLHDRIQMLKIWEHFHQDEAKPTPERKSYVKEIESFTGTKIKPQRLYSRPDAEGIL